MHQSPFEKSLSDWVEKVMPVRHSLSSDSFNFTISPPVKAIFGPGSWGNRIKTNSPYWCRIMGVASGAMPHSPLPNPHVPEASAKTGQPWLGFRVRKSLKQRRLVAEKANIYQRCCEKTKFVAVFLSIVYQCPLTNHFNTCKINKIVIEGARSRGMLLSTHRSPIPRVYTG